MSNLGTAEDNYASSDATQFVNEMTTIDAADRLAADQAAGADEGLTTTLTDDEAAVEGTLAGSGLTYQQEMAQGRSRRSVGGGP